MTTEDLGNGTMVKTVLKLSASPRWRMPVIWALMKQRQEILGGPETCLGSKVRAPSPPERLTTSETQMRGAGRHD